DEADGADALPYAQGRHRLRAVEEVRQAPGARAVDVLHRGPVQPRGPVAEAARAVRRRRADRAAPAQRGARPHPRRAQRGRDAPGGGRGDLPAGHLRRDARRRGRARGLRQRARRARRALSRRRGVAVSQRALDAAVDAARAAGRIALKYFRGGFEVAKKPDDTPVTQADREAEQAIVEILGRAFPDCGFFVQEGLGIVRKGGHWDGCARLIDTTDRQRGFGDYMGYGLVAEGKAEIYAELDLKPWDLAAPKILVEEAGGRFTDFAGRPTI